MAEYVVSPKNGSDQDAVAKTGEFLKQLTQQPNICSYTDITGSLMHWVLNVTDSQVQSTKGNNGVARVKQNTIMVEDFAAIPVPTEIAKLSETRNVKRDTQYSTQQDAVWELKWVSQPTLVPLPLAFFTSCLHYTSTDYLSNCVDAENFIACTAPPAPQRNLC